MKKQFWTHFHYQLNGILLDTLSIRTALNKLWSTRFIALDPQIIIYIIFKVKFDDGSYSSFSYLQKVTVSDLETLTREFIISNELKSENYHDKIASTIIFTYHIFDLDDSKNIEPKIISKKPRTPLHNLRGFNLPANTLYSTWGIKIMEDENQLIINKKGSRLVINYVINKHEDINKISVVIDLRNGKSLISVINDRDTKEKDISIPIAAATTAYARVFMSLLNLFNICLKALQSCLQSPTTPFYIR